MKPAIEESYSLKTWPSLIKNSFPIPNMFHHLRLTHSKVKVDKGNWRHFPIRVADFRLKCGILTGNPKNNISGRTK